MIIQSYPYHCNMHGTTHNDNVDNAARVSVMANGNAQDAQVTPRGFHLRPPGESDLVSVGTARCSPDHTRIGQTWTRSDTFGAPNSNQEKRKCTVYMRIAWVLHTGISDLATMNSS